MYIISLAGGAAQENIWFEAGSIGPNVGRANTEAENQVFFCTDQPNERIIYDSHRPVLASSIDRPGSSSGWKW